MRLRLGSVRRPALTRAGVQRWAPAAVLLVAFVVVSLLVVPRMRADGSARIADYGFNAGEHVAGQRTRGGITRGEYGFVVGAFSRGRVAFSMAVPPRAAGDRTTLFVTAGGPRGVSTRMLLLRPDGTSLLLGAPSAWQGRRVDLSPADTGPRIRLAFVVRNRLSSPELVVDEIRVVSHPPGAVPRASRWEVAVWLALAVLLVLAVAGRIRADSPAALAAGLTAWLVWPAAVGGALQTLESDVWAPAAHAPWVDLDHGLVSGTFGAASHLAVQLFHALTPFTGTGDAGGRTASMIVGAVAVVALYALGRRVAGLVGAVTAVVCALLCDPFRESLAAGTSVGTLVLASTLFLIAVHRVLVRTDRAGMLVLGAAGAVAVLAEPTWWPGVVATVVFFALRRAPRGTRRAALVAGIAALVVVSLPSRVSVAHQSGGDVNADVIQRATLARNVEFVGRGHTAPSTRAALLTAPYSGSQVGLGDYLFGDHSVTETAGGVLSGAYDGMSAAGGHPETGLAGTLAYVVELIGLVLLVLLPRLRALAIVPALLALVPWFFADKGSIAAFQAQAAFWPALLTGAAVAMFALRRLAVQTQLRERLTARIGPGRLHLAVRGGDRLPTPPAAAGAPPEREPVRAE